MERMIYRKFLARNFYAKPLEDKKMSYFLQELHRLDIQDAQQAWVETAQADAAWDDDLHEHCMLSARAEDFLGETVVSLHELNVDDAYRYMQKQGGLGDYKMPWELLMDWYTTAWSQALSMNDALGDNHVLSIN